MNVYVRTSLHDRFDVDSPCDYLEDTIALTRLLLMAAETLRDDDGLAIYQGVAQVLDRQKLLLTEMKS